ncbi:MAG TPA: hypothetical protein VK558_17675, partial [Patescibacteria group bacterium]|nr:hypothetical protein [Patescibacteria group bacterium]
GGVIVGLFLLGWANLVLTAQALSLVSALGVTAAYLPLSLFIGVLTTIGLRALAPQADEAEAQFGEALPPRFSKQLLWLLAVTAGLAALATLVIGATHIPSNPDSIVYRFPRVYWYFAHGSFSHFSNVVDPRAVYYPTNGVAAYLPLLHYQFGPMLFTAPSVLCWVMIGLTTYLFARDLGGSKIASAATAWVIVLTPNILIQALSTNDEIIAASAMLAGLYFLHRWFKARQQFDFLIGFSGVFLSGGTKLHLTFYWPLFVIIAVTLALHHRALRRELSRWINWRGLAILAVTVALFIAMFCSFMIYNYESTGHVMEWNFAGQVLNAPFNPKVALQTILVYASQIVLAPVPDLYLILDGGSRAPAYAAYNELLAPLFGWVNNGAEYTSVGYRFTGITAVAAIFRNEQTVLIGLTWLVALIAGLRLFRRPASSPLWSRFHWLGLPVWFLTWAASTKYIEGIPVYISYALIVAGPTLVYAFAPIANRRLSALRWAALAVVAATHCVFAANILASNSSRALYFLHHAPKLPISRAFSADPNIDFELALAKNGVTDHTIAWAQPHWIFMMKNPQSRHRLTAYPAEIKGPSDGNFNTFMLQYSREVVMPAPGDLSLHLYPLRQYPTYGFVPLRITGKASPGLTLVGSINFALGPEWLFAAGNDIEKRRPEHSGYIAISFQEVSTFGRDLKPVLEVSPYLYGLGEKDRLMFRYALKIDGTVVDHSDWDTSPGVHLNTTGLTATNGVLHFEVRNDNAGGTVDGIDVPLRSFQPLTLN